MKDLQAPFSAFMQELIGKELDEIQQEQFAIEGDEIIESLFTNYALPVYSDGNALDYDFGIAPSDMRLKNADISFIDIIHSCFSLLEEIHRNKLAQNNTDDKDPSYWENFFSTTDVSQPVIELFCGPYKNQLINLFALL